MQELPKTARERMAAMQPSPPHLDANLISAFVEHALLPPERQRVIAHMAVCATCRSEVQLLLSVQAEAHDAEQVRDPAAPIEPVRRGLAWQRLLRWQPMAAAAAVAAISLAFWMALRQPSSHSATANRSAPAATPSTIANNMALPSPPVSAANPARPAKSPAPRNATKESERDLGSLEKLRANEARNPVQQRDAGAVNQIDSRLVSEKDVTPSVVQAESKQAGVGPPPPPAPVSASALAAPAASSSQPQPTLAAGQLAPAPSSGMVNVEAVPSAGVKKEPLIMSQRSFLAKAATAGRAVAARIEPATSWAASTDSSSADAHSGAVERSFDGGHTWQLVPVAQGVTFRVVFAWGRDVWAGGTAGAFFHSSDGGRNWAAVPLPQTPTNTNTTIGDIVSIQFDNALHGVVRSSSGPIWITSDGGRTWQAQ
jgi:hypothetical protein